MDSGGADLLYALRNNFHLGAYQAAVGEAQDLQHDDLGGAETVERDIFLYRAYIELGQPQVALSEITNESSVALQACKLLAQIRSDPTQKETIVAQVTDWLSDPAYCSNLLLCELCGEIYMATEMYEEALKCCSSAGSLELLALAIQVALQIERPDVANKMLGVMQEKDDDAPLTQLANAWVNIATGGERVQEAGYIFQELGDRFNWTPKLLNGSAICNMVMGRFDQAEKQILEALSKDPRNPDTLANVITNCLHLNKPTTKYLAQLKAADPNHPLLKKLEGLEDKFNSAAAAF
jgi:coatomer protein complex subunit epsilon